MSDARRGIVCSLLLGLRLGGVASTRSGDAALVDGCNRLYNQQARARARAQRWGPWGPWGCAGYLGHSSPRRRALISPSRPIGPPSPALRSLHRTEKGRTHRQECVMDACPTTDVRSEVKPSASRLRLSTHHSLASLGAQIFPGPCVRHVQCWDGWRWARGPFKLCKL